MFISRLDPETTEDQFTAFVESQFGSANSSNSSSSSSLFQSQRSLKSQLNRKQSMLTIISTGNREEAKRPKWSSSLLLPS